MGREGKAGARRLKMEMRFQWNLRETSAAVEGMTDYDHVAVEGLIRG